MTGSFVRHAEFLVDPSLGFAIGWNLVYGNLLSIPSEITAICVLFQFWTDISSALWIVIFIVMTITVGVAFVRGEYKSSVSWQSVVSLLPLTWPGYCIQSSAKSNTSSRSSRSSS